MLFRSVHGARVRWAFPHRFAGERDGRLALYCAPGSEGRLVGRGPDGRYLARWVAGEEPGAHTWVDTHVVWLVRPGDLHGLGLFWDEAWSFLGWYVNLQAPLVSSPVGFDSQDWDLDVVVEPDGTWAWKDEDDFADAQALGVLDAETAAAARAEGERVVDERPWPTGWESWRPPTDWTPPPLPDRWDAV